MIRLTVPSIDQEDLDAVSAVIASGFLIQGPHVAEFEAAVAKLTGAAYAVAVANGTCALQSALAALDVGPGDICVLPTYSWVATANVIELCGARPVFVDIDPETFNLDPNKLDDALQKLSDQKVKAVMPVHAFGQIASMAEINEICERRNVPVVEDAACALGASLDGRQAGRWGAMGCFSFHPRKAITTGEGGMVVTDDARLARRLRALRNHGADPESSSPDFIMAGYNYRLTEFQGALGVVQMKKLDRIIGKRVEGARRYDAALANTEIQSPRTLSGACHVYQSYVGLLPERAAAHRRQIITEAKQRGVELQIGTIHMPLTTFYRNKYGFRRGDFPATDSVDARALTLPLHETLTAAEQQTVLETVFELLQ